MPIVAPTDFVVLVPHQARVMALDVGTKTIGLATGARAMGIVLPLKTLQRTKFTTDAARLWDLTKEYDVHGLVVGLPLMLDGREGRRCQSVRDFTVELDKILKTIPITFQDERFSTIAASEKQDDLEGMPGTGPAIDTLAASEILERFFEAAAAIT